MVVEPGFGDLGTRIITATLAIDLFILIQKQILIQEHTSGIKRYLRKKIKL
jgi:hypothetical protein